MTKRGPREGEKPAARPTIPVKFPRDGRKVLPLGGEGRRIKGGMKN